MNTPKLIIAGMHRSGTSLVTQWLHQCGLMVGEQLLGKGIGNDDGHFEDLEFYHFHQSVLSAQGLPDSGFVDTSVSQMTEEQRIEATKIIQKRNQKFPQWGWKDPRTCLFIKDYQFLIPDAKYLIIVRDFRETVSSLITRDYKALHINDPHQPNLGFFKRIKRARRKKRELNELCRSHAPFFLKVWIQYNQNLLKLMKVLPQERFMIVSYESLRHMDRLVFDRMCQDWNFRLNHVDFNQIFKPSMINDPLPIHKYVDAGLHHDAAAMQQELWKKLSVQA